MSIAEMRMNGNPVKDRIIENIRGKLGVALIKDKKIENRLGWFGHVCRCPIDAIF